MDIFLYSVCSCIFGALGAWFICRWGNSFGLLDRSNKRSSHEGVIPKGGGIGILAAFILASLALKIAVTFWIPAAFLALLSFWDDKFDLSPKLRLPVQFITAFSFLIPISDLWLLTPVFSLLLTIFFVVFIVATANWYNFMDGINGIAAITGIVGFGLLAAFNILSSGDTRFTVLTICIVLSCLGFLPFNLPKAKVFMGDVGSILLGFAFAAIMVMLSKSFLDFICLAAFLFPFYADEIFTMAVRLKDGESLLQPHRRHIYQLMANEMGIDHWKVSVGYGVFQLIVGLGVLLVRPLGLLSVIILLCIFFVGFVWANYFVRGKS